MQKTTATANSHLHPIFAGILAQAAAVPSQVRRAEYVSRLLRMDWQFEHAPAEQWRKGRAELEALQKLREEIDAQHVLWNRHAAAEYCTHDHVRSFKDFTGHAPVTVEWSEIDGAPRVIAVVIEITGVGPRSITPDLTPECLARYQAKLDQLVASADQFADKFEQDAAEEACFERMTGAHA